MSRSAIRPADLEQGSLVDFQERQKRRMIRCQWVHEVWYVCLPLTLRDWFAAGRVPIAGSQPIVIRSPWQRRHSIFPKMTKMRSTDQLPSGRIQSWRLDAPSTPCSEGQPRVSRVILAESDVGLTHRCSLRVSENATIRRAVTAPLLHTSFPHTAPSSDPSAFHPPSERKNSLALNISSCGCPVRVRR